MRNDPLLTPEIWPPLVGDDGIGPARLEIVREWSLLLAAFGIPHKIEKTPDGSALLRLDPFQRGAAIRQLLLWKAEAPYAPPPPSDHRWKPALLIPGLLLLFHFHTLLAPVLKRSLFNRGFLSGSALSQGELWRPLTALFFHNDLLHLIFNIIPLALLIPAIAARTGGVIARTWLLLAAVGGNALAALVREEGIRSIGASTMVFVALGFALLLRDTEHGWGRLWLGVAGAGVLFLSLSAGADTDISAHLFGFATGLVAGACWVLGPWRKREPGRGIKFLFTGATLLFVGYSLFCLFR